MIQYIHLLEYRKLTVFQKVDILDHSHHGQMQVQLTLVMRMVLIGFSKWYSVQQQFQFAQVLWQKESSYGHNLILSAIAPEQIETVVAQNTIWKNQSEPSA